MNKTQQPVVAIVTGASRGAGRGIAVALGSHGCTVYVTGRSENEGDGEVPGTIHATAREVTEAGGTGIAVKCDHADDAQVKALVAVLAKIGVSGIAANFLKLVAQKRRLFAVGDMIEGFNKLNDAAKGVSRAEVTVASALSGAQMDALKAQLMQVTGGKSVDVAVKIDPSIIGGLIVKLGSRMVDGSLKTKLNSIRTRMKEVG